MRKALQNVPEYHRAVLELIFAGAIWGISFTFVKWALADFTAWSLIFWRFLIAVVLAEIILFFGSRANYKISHSDFKISAFAGISLGSALLLQTHGLNYTTATNSSFITSLYVVMIPFANTYFFKTKVEWYHAFLGFLAFGGMGFLLDLNAAGFKFNAGDLMTLGAAVASTFHIIAVGLGAKKMKNAFRFNTMQTLWAWILVLPFITYDALSGNPQAIIPDQISTKSIVSILSLACLVSIGAFYLQIRAQRTLSATTASMLCLLEAPYSFTFAVVLLNESLSPFQFMGAGLIMLSSFISVYIDRPKNRKS